MNRNNKIFYVVTSGEYSDYTIRGVFDDKELAQRFVDKYKARASRDDPWCIEVHYGASCG